MPPETLLSFELPVKGPDGRAYAARACGRDRPDGLYEGWLEFELAVDGSVVRTARETTQPNRTDLVYWASGLTPIYLEGALARALEPVRRVVTRPDSPPAFDGPADTDLPPPDVNAAIPTDVSPDVDAVLDPFSVYQKGEDVLRRQLGALAAWHLRNIALAYRLVPNAVEAEVSAKAALIERIVTGVREGYAAAPVTSAALP